jgi:hypothetical protein
MTFTAPAIGSLVLRTQDLFVHAPTTPLTLPQVARRLGLDACTSAAVLGALVDAHVLTRTPAGAYLRYFPRQAHAA